jgi:DNA-binding MarR family transcriptional regulator
VKDREQTIRDLARRVFEMTVHTWLSTQREKLKGGYDLSESEFLALDALEDGETLTVGDLRRRVGVLPAQMSRILKALEQRYDEKLVVCSINPRDKRKIDVAITPRGRRAVEAYRRAKIMATVEAIRSLSDRDLAALLRLLNQIQDVLERDRDAGPNRRGKAMP